METRSVPFWSVMRVVMALFSLPNYRGRVLSIVTNSAIRYLLKFSFFHFLVTSSEQIILGGQKMSDDSGVFQKENGAAVQNGG